MTDQIPIRITVSEAARLFGVSTKTIRKAIASNEVLYVVVRGRYKLNFTSVLKWSQTSTRRRNLLNRQGIGQFVDGWNIANKKFSPNPELLKRLGRQSVSDQANQSDKKI